MHAPSAMDRLPYKVPKLGHIRCQSWSSPADPTSSGRVSPDSADFDSDPRYCAFSARSSSGVPARVSRVAGSAAGAFAEPPGLDPADSRSGSSSTAFQNFCGIAWSLAGALFGLSEKIRNGAISAPLGHGDMAGPSPLWSRARTGTGLETPGMVVAVNDIEPVALLPLSAAEIRGSGLIFMPGGSDVGLALERLSLPSAVRTQTVAACSSAL